MSGLDSLSASIGARALVTGAAGFKGRWLMDLLARIGVHPIGWDIKDPADPGSYDWARIDLREPFEIPDEVDVVFHLAAQAFVPEGYRDPAGTWHTNVMTTVNLLESMRARTAPLVAVIVTSDKVYRLPPMPRPLREDDELGGYCPYSTSKAACELVVQSYRSLLPAGVRVATARAGNVVGGADFSHGRLVPDIIESARLGNAVELRNPGSTRPWLFVLDCLWGYVSLAQSLAAGNEPGDSMNFGPNSAGAWTAREIAGFLSDRLGLPEPIVGPAPSFAEAPYLQLSTDLAAQQLAWQARLSTADALEWSAQWASQWLIEPGSASRVVDEQITRYLELVRLHQGVGQ